MVQTSIITFDPGSQNYKKNYYFVTRTEMSSVEMPKLSFKFPHSILGIFILVLFNISTFFLIFCFYKRYFKKNGGSQIDQIEN